MPILLGPSHSEKWGRKIVPLIPLREAVVFPNTEAILTFGRPKSLAGINAAFKSKRLICFVAQKNAAVEGPSIDDIYRVGTLCTVERMMKIGDDIHAFIQGLMRVTIEDLKAIEPFLIAEVTPIAEIIIDSEEVTALCKHLTSQFKKAVSNLGKSVDFLVFMKLMSGVKPGELADQVASTLDIPLAEKQKLLEITDVKMRLEKVSVHLAKETKILEIERSIASKTQKKLDKSMKEAVLRERMRTIQKELGEKEGEEIKDWRSKVKKAGMSKKVAEKTTQEVDRLAQIPLHSPERGYILTYLSWLISMPWSIRTANNKNIKEASKILNEDHYGLKEVKERVLEYLAVMKLKAAKKKNKEEKKALEEAGGTILCFVGPPGVGKTSMGKSIARALGRKFVRMSLGGIRDEAEIRGHRRTYVGALPGRIIQGVKNAGTKNPVYMLDEIDKVGTDFRGDPSAALLEALDPEQNREFSDHYLEVPFDLSEVMFITTANILDTIPPALKDRLEVIRFPGYTQDEKYHIAKDFLIKKTLIANGLTKTQFTLPAATLRKIIKRYTREAGVRNLEREIAKIMRKVARSIAEGKKKKEKVTAQNLGNYLGPEKFSETLAEKENEVGMATGLAWTEAGGDILFIEVALMPGKGKIFLTGQLGNVMKESCQAAISYIRSRWEQLKLKKNFFQTLDVHVHVPEGAVPKDGPSAGCAIGAAIVSALTKKPTKKEMGMTGEITLRGKIYEIGGVKEKILAAHRAGLKEVILPKTNKKDMVEIPKKVKDGIKFHFVDDMDEVLKLALAK